MNQKSWEGERCCTYVLTQRVMLSETQGKRGGGDFASDTPFLAIYIPKFSWLRGIGTRGKMTLFIR